MKMSKAPEYRWPEVKAMLDDISPENTHYSRVQALIRCGDDLLADHARLVKIIYRWHGKYTELSQKVKEFAIELER